MESIPPGTSDLGVMINSLYFTVFTGIESIPPGTSNLGVMINIKLNMLCSMKGKKNLGKCCLPEIGEGMPHGDMARIHCTRDSRCAQCHGNYSH